MSRLSPRTLMLVLLGAPLFPGCSREEGGASSHAVPPAGSAAEGPEYQVNVVEDGATLRGTITYARTPPERERLIADRDQEACGKHEIRSERLIVSPEGKVENAVVWLKDVRQGKAWPQSETVLDQKGCVYLPHVIAVGAEQPIKFLNSDPVIHNINTFPRENPPLNVNLLPAGKGRPVIRSFRFADEIKVTCDSHEWMGAWIAVRENPYFAITGPDGTYAIEEIPPGSYTLVVWHESLAGVEKRIELGARQTAIEDLVLKDR